MNELDPERLLPRLKAIQRTMRHAILADMRAKDLAQRAAVAQDETGGDTIYALDQGVEGTLLQACRLWGQEERFVLIAEGLTEGGNLVFPEETPEEAGSFRVIFDPLDAILALEITYKGQSEPEKDAHAGFEGVSIYRLFAVLSASGISLRNSAN